ncbi:MAG: AlpA family transcriptional regulator [Vicinamibacterales bacterium]
MNTPPTTLIRLPEVLRRVALSRSSIYLRINQGSFPRPVKLGPSVSRWLESDIEAWLQTQITTPTRHPRSRW